MLLFQSMSIINDGLGQAFMPKREYESLREEEKAWGKIQRPVTVSFMAVIWLAVIVSTGISLKIVFPVHEGNVSAARNVGVWQGTCYLTPLIGAVLEDGYWGRYWTISIFSMIYFVGMCILTISASVPSLKPAECLGSVCPPASPLQYYLFYFGLHVIALGTGGVKSCVSPFRADQFDETDS